MQHTNGFWQVSMLPGASALTTFYVFDAYNLILLGMCVRVWLLGIQVVIPVLDSGPAISTPFAFPWKPNQMGFEST
jgi:hypothetical protein